MTKNNDPQKDSLAEIAIDPDVLARELALEDLFQSLKLILLPKHLDQRQFQLGFLFWDSYRLTYSKTKNINS